MLGTLLDGVPELLVLGMGLAVGGAVSASFLVAVFVSNLPEAVGGTVALRARERRRGRSWPRGRGWSPPPASRRQ